MINNAKYGILEISNSNMEYICFGHGSKTLILLPGLGEALRSLKGTALPMSVLYSKLSDHYTVYVFSRITQMPTEYSTEDMAKDVISAMDLLCIEKSDIVGVSMGGMIAQHLASKYTERVNKLVLVVTSARQNPVLKSSIEEWINYAKANDHEAFMDSNIKRIYTSEYYRKNKRFIPLVAKLTKPKSYSQFYIQASACYNHCCFEALSNITCPTLVVGGELDNCLGGDASREIAAQIPNSELYMYSDYGHGLYDEAMDFKERILHFLQKESN